MVQSLKKSGTNSSSATTKAKKPYTEYTIFFRLEQTYLLQTTTGTIDEEILELLDPNHYDALEFPRPPKYQSQSMPPYWYSSAQKAQAEKKRKHRKREGRIDLKTLSKTISTNWRNADQVTIQYCRKLAQAEQKKYDENVRRIETQKRLDEEVNAEFELFNTAGEGLYHPPPTQLQLNKNNVPSPMPSSSSDTLNLWGIQPQPNNSAEQQQLAQLPNNNQGHQDNDVFLGLGGMPQLPFNTSTPNTPTIDSNDSSSTTALYNNNNLNKRKYVRRASAPPEFMVGMLQRPNINTTTMNQTVHGNNNFQQDNIMSSSAGMQYQHCQPVTNTTKLEYNSNNNNNFSILPSHELQGMKETFRMGLDSSSHSLPFPSAASMGNTSPFRPSNVTSSSLNGKTGMCGPSVVSSSSSQHSVPDNMMMSQHTIPEMSQHTIPGNMMMCGAITSTNNAIPSSMANNNVNVFQGDDLPPKLAHRIKRRASVGPGATATHQLGELKRSFQEELSRHGGNVNVQNDFDNYLSGCSHEELEEGEEEPLFQSVPKWDKEDADALLDVLSEH